MLSPKTNDSVRSPNICVHRRKAMPEHRRSVLFLHAYDALWVGTVKHFRRDNLAHQLSHQPFLQHVKCQSTSHILYSLSILLRPWFMMES